MNRLKTMMLMAAMTALFLFIGQALGGRSGLTFALVLAAVMNMGAYWFSDKIVLSMYRAKPLSADEAPELFSIVERLAAQWKIPMPKVYLVPQETPNAFATGRSPQHAAVAVTAGIMQLLDYDELEGVIAHELSHVINRDTLISSIAATMAGALSHLANMAMWGSMFGGRSRDREEGGNPLIAIVGMILAPLAATLIQMAISRSREFLADETGAHLCGKPLALASALRKIESWKHEIPMVEGSPATAHMFIINPFSARGMIGLFSTHPPTEERVKRLESMQFKATVI